MIYFYAPEEQLAWINDYQINISIFRDIKTLTPNMNDFNEHDVLIITYLKDKLYDFRVYNFVRDIIYASDSYKINIYNPLIKTIRGDIIYNAFDSLHSFPFIDKIRMTKDFYTATTKDYIPSFLFFGLILDKQLMKYLHKKKKYDIIEMIAKYLQKYPNKKLFDGKNVMIYRNLVLPKELAEKEINLFYNKEEKENVSSNASNVSSTSKKKK